MATEQSGCPDSLAPPPLSKEAALAQLLAAVRPLDEVETIPTDQGLGRVLARALTSAIAVPGWDNSAMDGYAVRCADLAAGPARLRVTQRIPAGTLGQPLEPRTAARIFTGAPIPTGADAVVIQEYCTRDADWVEVPGHPTRGANIRRTGEDICVGTEVIAPGTRLRPQHLGLAASVGATQLSVYRRLRVTMFASGDELVMPGEPLGPGQIYNSNRFTLKGLLVGLGCEVSDLGQVPDSLEATMAALARAAAGADLILGSGGVSVGEEDHVKPAIERLGTLDLWNVAIRPGKPLAFGHVHGTPFLGTPGNPVSLFVTFLVFARPLVLRMQGVTGDLEPPALKVRADFDVPRPDRRREFQRARLTRGTDGEWEAVVYASRSPGVLSSAAWADGLVEIPAGQTVARGDPVIYIPFGGLLS
ncbi:gephyrin-like molybdotransferase Glp [uncultured Thiodictyon sp.]|uniref:molybdopterin molybdotransferase MoeA n=1 Tax=uncultured Thiodictyon sp. TaxID=1846217 RepID=UPI0025E70BD1|nr:gephyrin-like molybdotransferase Glp [uncultured Thiodictyon sp.]